MSLPAKSAEQLIILADIATGLMSRLYMMCNYQKPEVLTNDVNVEKYCKALIKKFPDFPDSLNKLPGADVFSKRVSEITVKLSDYYNTFLGVLNFIEEAWKCILELSKNILEFKSTINPDLMAYYLNLFNRYVQIHLMINFVPEGKMLLACFAKAHHVTHGNTEANFIRIATFLTKNENPLKRLQEECAEISMRIGDAIISFLQPISKWSNVKILIDSRVFNIIDESKYMTIPHEEKNHMELLNIANYRYWSLIGLLVCPAELQRPGAFELLSACLKETFVIPVFRDKVINIHEEFAKLFDWFKVQKFRLSKNKKILKEAYMFADGTVDNHFAMRTYLRVELETLLHFFKEYPGTIPAKIQMVYALLELSRNEVLWYFRHMDVTPYKARKYQWKEDPYISFLIYYIVQLCEVCTEHKKAIQNYYLEFLNGADSKVLRPLIETFSKSVRMNTGTQQLFNTLAESITKASIDDNFEVIRLNWYRLSAAFSHQQSGISAKSAEKLAEAMAYVVSHTRNIDCVTAQLREHGSLVQLYWYREELTKMLKDCLSGINGQARHCLSFVKILNDGLQQIHRVCPEEQLVIGKECVTLADHFLRQIVAGVERIIKSLILKTRDLRLQLAPIQVVARHEAQLEEQQHEPLPGAESLYENRKSTEWLRLWRKSIAEICSSIRETDSIVVYNIEFIPREYLYESMSSNIRTTLRLLATSEKNIERPTMLLQKFKDVIHSYNTVERHVNINLCDIIRDVLLGDSYDELAGNVGEIVFRDGKDEKKEQKANQSMPLIHAISAWYLALMQRDLDELGISYSPLKKGFVSRPVSRVKGERPTLLLRADRYTDVNELKALCTLCGPYGVRFIDRGLLFLIQYNVGIIKDILKENYQVLSPLQGRLNELKDAIAKVNPQGLEKLLRHSIVVGCILKFRETMREALQEVVKERVPFIYDTVKLVQHHIPEQSYTDPRLVALDVLAADCGIDLKDSDHSLRSALQRYKTQPSDAQMFALLPELYGISFVCSKWNETLFLIDSEGHSTNVHCMVPCIHALISNFHRMSVKGEHVSNPSDAIQNDLERFVRCAAHTILHKTATDSTYPLDSVMLFLEQFIVGSNGKLQQAFLEDCFPFALLRSGYIHLVDTQTSRAQRITAEGKETEEKEQ